MQLRFLAVGVTAGTLLLCPLSGQTIPRRASMTGGGSPDRGKCTIEIVVDGAAEVEIRGDNAILRNLAGQPAQWRRFQCTSAMPGNPPNFRFTGIDGRGSQELVRGPQNGGAAIVRIQDPQGGSEGYTFDVTWGGAPGRDFGDGARDFGDRGRPSGGGRYTTEQAVRVCQDSIRKQAWDRFHNGDIAFRRTGLDDNPGRNDWVTGFFDIRHGNDRDETYRFSCSVNFDTGQVRSAQIDPIGPGDRDRYMPGYGDARESSNKVAMASCEKSVEDNIRQKGYPHVDFLSINVDDRPGRNDWIVGIARADGRMRSDSFNFSCSVDLRNGDVRSVDVRPR